MIIPYYNKIKYYLEKGLKFSHLVVFIDISDIEDETIYYEYDETNKIAVIAPKATINIIKNYKLIEKRRVALPNEIDRIFRCSNPDCITNSTEHIESIMDLIDKEKMILKCRYCARILDVNKIKYN